MTQRPPPGETRAPSRPAHRGAYHRKDGPRIECDVFFSYSRQDEDLVRTLETLLRAGGADVWIDHMIQAGDPWRQTISREVKRCERLVVFWCRHSAASVEVRNEYALALAKQRRVIPVRLDGTTLPAALSPYQAVDLRYVTWVRHELGRAAAISALIGVISIIIGGLLRAFL